MSADKRQQKLDILTKNAPRYKPKYLQTLMTSVWDDLGIEARRLRTILEQEGCCNKCGISEWQGIHITLEYEHKDGNNANNDRSNVEALCPNCHSQTSTWRGRKNGIKQARVIQYLEISKE